MGLDRPDNEATTITSSRFLVSTKLDITDVASVHTLLDESKAVEVYNDGPNTVHREINAAATTNSRPIRPRTSWSGDVDASTFGLICETDQTATIWIEEYG